VGVKVVNLNDKTLELTFPCDWQYRVVGRSKDGIEEAANKIFGGKEYKLAPSKASSSGKFVSFNIDTLVFSHDERLALHEALKKEPAILYVL
jgi:putative lipoic acid-binding regulatory protein